MSIAGTNAGNSSRPAVMKATYGVAFSPDDHISANDELIAVAFSLDRTLLAPGGYDKRIYLWGVPQ